MGIRLNSSIIVHCLHAGGLQLFGIVEVVRKVIGTFASK